MQAQTWKHCSLILQAIKKLIQPIYLKNQNFILSATELVAWKLKNVWTKLRYDKCLYLIIFNPRVWMTMVFIHLWWEVIKYKNTQILSFKWIWNGMQLNQMRLGEMPLLENGNARWTLWGYKWSTGPSAYTGRLIDKWYILFEN